MRRIALLLEYDGTAFSGSQLQRERRTVQGDVEAAWSRFTGETSRARFAGRTDAGVHAVGQVATIDTERDYDARICRAAMNHFLMADLAVRAVTEVATSFDARRHASSRVYQYEIEDGRTRSPLSRSRAWQRACELDVAEMSEAARALPHDERDWAAFSGPVPEGYPTVRLLQRCDVRRSAPRRMTVTMEASGFLPHQVRRTVGALAEVGEGRLTAEAFVELINGAPASAGPTAPPQGLTLMQVHYPLGVIDWTAGCAGDGTEEF
jgi:tRNA pseudouridine38-40 synthase